MRVTWVQPEDLVGHELREAREEGKDVDEIEARWFAAGGASATAGGIADPRAPELVALALELLDELDALPSPFAATSRTSSKRSRRGRSATGTDGRCDVPTGSPVRARPRRRLRAGKPVE